MLCTAEGLARSAEARLELLGRGETTHTKDKAKKIRGTDVDAPMVPTAATVDAALVPALGSGPWGVAAGVLAK